MLNRWKFPVLSLNLKVRLSSYLDRSHRRVWISKVPVSKDDTVAYVEQVESLKKKCPDHGFSFAPRRIFPNSIFVLFFFANEIFSLHRYECNPYK